MSLDELINEYEARNPVSKGLWQDASEIIPGGVSANVKFYSPFPLFMKEGKGAYLFDVDDHRYIDYSLSYGPLILGHGRKEIEESVLDYFNDHSTILFGPPHKGEIDLARLIKKYYPSIEMLRFTNSGTEATLLAIRMACAYTNKHKIAKFEGHYHGGHNDVLVSVNPKIEKAGDRQSPISLPASKGITKDQLGKTIVLPFNDLESCEKILRANGDEIGCVILEPFQGGTIPAKAQFLTGLRKITEELGIVLIFDEVKTGFRVGLGGAQGLYGIKPDLTTLGKIIGGGLPIGLVGGKKDILEQANPNSISFLNGDKSIDRAEAILFHSGTYNGHPLITHLGSRTISILEKEMTELISNTEKLKAGIKDIYKKHGIRVLTPGVGAMFHICITDQKELLSYRDLKRCDFNLRRKLDYALFLDGIYNKPCTRYHTSTAHTQEVIEETLEAYEKAFCRL